MFPASGIGFHRRFLSVTTPWLAQPGHVTQPSFCGWLSDRRGVERGAQRAGERASERESGLASGRRDFEVGDKWPGVILLSYGLTLTVFLTGWRQVDLTCRIIVCYEILLHDFTTEMRRK